MARSTAVAKPKTGTGVAVLSAERQKELDELKARLAAPSGDKIKIDNKQFKLPSGEVLDFLDVCIVDFVYMNKYYEGAYDSNSIVPPDCFAISPEPTNMVPSKNSPEMQCEGCQACAMNQFGSAGKGKACQNRCVLAVLPRDATVETPLVLLDLSPTAVKPFSAYVTTTARALGKLPYEVMSHVECNPALKHDVAMFSDPQPIDDEDFIEMVRSRKAEARTRLMTEPDVSPPAANEGRSKVKTKLQAPKRRAA